ncbi:MAG: helix-turn-helix domain-containing protein, partial [Actinomadura rubrobrunea]|nr:helix-turn-helix domain-containing protein [Actinomadura rubrobrunea]
MAGSAFEPIHLPDWVWRTPEADKILSARDVGALFRLAKRYAGASQHRIAAATSIGQPRVNSLMRGTGSPIEKFELFERIADGLNMPDHARVRLGLAPRNPLAEAPQPSLTDTQPPARLPDAPSPSVLAGLREVLNAYIQADAVMGALCLLPAVHSQIPVIERICHTARGVDRIEALNV